MSKNSEIIAEAIYYAIKNNRSLEAIQDSLEALNKVYVKIYRENDTIPFPKYGNPGDACMDVYADSIEQDLDKNRIIVHTGLHFELPEGYEMELRPRSSNTKYRWAILNSSCTLDEPYRGELMVIFTPLDKDVDLFEDFPYKEGDRVCQLLVRHREEVVWDEVEKLSDLSTTVRGNGGFGSTGK